MTIKYTSERHKGNPEGEKFRYEHLGAHFTVRMPSEFLRK